MEIPKPALFLAGKAFVQYRRSGGTKSNISGDFLIGAHAAVSGLPVYWVMWRDVVVFVIADGRRDMQSLLARRLLGA